MNHFPALMKTPWLFLCCWLMLGCIFDGDRDKKGGSGAPTEFVYTYTASGNQIIFEIPEEI